MSNQRARQQTIMETRHVQLLRSTRSNDTIRPHTRAGSPRTEPHQAVASSPWGADRATHTACAATRLLFHATREALVRVRFLYAEHENEAPIYAPARPPPAILLVEATGLSDRLPLSPNSRRRPLASALDRVSRRLDEEPKLVASVRPQRTRARLDHTGAQLEGPQRRSALVTRASSGINARVLTDGRAFPEL